MPHVATQVANLLQPVRGCPPCPEQGLCSPAARPASEGTATEQDFAIVLFAPINPAFAQKFSLVTLGQARQLLLAKQKVTELVLEMPNWFFSTFSEGNIEFWKAPSLEQLSNFHNTERREKVAHPSRATIFWCLQHSSEWVISHFL